MKKIVAFAGFALLSVGAFAQTNLQFFYDLGKDRKMVTTTLEMFKGDDWGSTFFFVDYDYFNKDFRDEEVAGVKIHPDTYGARSSYFDIARSLNFWQESSLGVLSAHIEFNGGVGFGNRNWLFGAEYFLHNDDFSNTFTFELLYKTFKGSESHLPLQFTFVWGMQNIFGVEGLKFSGFCDLWGEDGPYADKDKRQNSLTFISEPQLWYNVGQFFGCENLSAGCEVELSSNFAGNQGFMCNPCLGLKWDF